MSVARRKARALMQEEEIASRQLGNWIAMHMKHNEKKTIVTNICQIPSLTNYGPKCFCDTT